MSNEPVWPSVTQVKMRAAAGWVASETDVKLAIEMCREAWRLTYDDPSQSPIGEVRQNPRAENYLVIRTADTPYPWYVFRPGNADGTAIQSGDGHARVKGWPVIGAVPGTPAAEVAR